MNTPIKSSFLADYIKLVSEAIDADHQGNHDFVRFGQEQLTVRDLLRQVVKLQQSGQETEIDSGILTVHRLKSGETLSFSPGGPGTALSAPSGRTETSVKTMHIDWLVGTGAAQKIDFIKMDIEGAELQALKGAEQTIKKFRPKLAITVYTIIFRTFGLSRNTSIA